MDFLKLTKRRKMLVSVFTALLIIALLLLSVTAGKQTDQTDYTMPGFGMLGYLDTSDRRKISVVYHLDMLDYLYLLGYLDTDVEIGMDDDNLSILASNDRADSTDSSSDINTRLSGDGS
ncbi:MAG: hypothetical protein BWY28_01916 [bacterium ADurb.Bin236]|nr:MAG: hypothetical protein BWY28_01916 [bacterium ADurb.Bin236]